MHRQQADIAAMSLRKPHSIVCADAMFNLALLLQRNNKHAQAAEYWRRYLANDTQSEWAARARRSLKFCEMQVHISNS
jgi:TolA-binding protein